MLLKKEFADLIKKLTVSLLVAQLFTACMASSAVVSESSESNQNSHRIFSYYRPSRHIPDYIKGNNASAFERIATFPVFLNTSIDTKTVCEIVAASEDGNTLVYTDSAGKNVGFVDITDASKPKPAGIVKVGGEPTSVAVWNYYALVAVNTSPSLVAPSGELIVIDIDNHVIVARHDVGGQPDSITVSPDKQYAAIVIENERDEDLGNGEPPQAPGGVLISIHLLGAPEFWMPRAIELNGIAELFPNDPEPEVVDINSDNIAAVTFQENNHIALIDLASGKIVESFSAGRVNLEQIDTVENGIIELNGSLRGIAREPDGVSWINDTYFATADEGDLFGGSRGFTVYNFNGQIAYTSGNANEHLVTRLGHYPESRSENRGNEPESVEFGVFDRQPYLFVGSERSSVIFVYKLRGYRPHLLQVLPTGTAPEGLLAIPQRDLFIAASEEDRREDKLRSVLTIYRRTATHIPSYPTIVSNDRRDGTPIPWAALSGLAADTNFPLTIHAVPDGYYNKSRIFSLNIAAHPAQITHEVVLYDSMGALAAIDADLVNTDGSVNLDLEGISASENGGFWLVSEGAGTVGSSSNPFESYNLLLKVKHSGVIEQVITLPDSTNSKQVRFGFEGVAATGKWNREKIYVAFQREWRDDPNGLVRIGIYDVHSSAWTFLYYPLDEPLSANGGWVGLSEITALPNMQFAVIERDNQAGPDAAIKRVYRFSVAGLTPQPDVDEDVTPAFPTVKKTLVRDLIPDQKRSGGLVLEKLEGMAVSKSGTAFIVNDNDGVEDSNGETQLIRIRNLFH